MKGGVFKRQARATPPAKPAGYLARRQTAYDGVEHQQTMTLVAEDGRNHEMAALDLIAWPPRHSTSFADRW